ncbi:hypothetical protein EJ04DRAFT_197499 [Polyplosphaeria fusca]|uniref:Uncharacterized protein n=1 Tax=Polyplosphaeria fusca TaxID=682080 RepID=A0A9P4R7B9_9PLEO|nr:hypothetical protein EJ04DRAFT_197499 [Polyplosphaeria fusca]
MDSAHANVQREATVDAATKPHLIRHVTAYGPILDHHITFGAARREAYLDHLFGCPFFVDLINCRRSCQSMVGRTRMALIPSRGVHCGPPLSLPCAQHHTTSITARIRRLSVLLLFRLRAHVHVHGCPAVGPDRLEWRDWGIHRAVEPRHRTAYSANIKRGRLQDPSLKDDQVGTITFDLL